MKHFVFTLAAFFVAGATLTACSKSSPPPNPTAVVSEAQPPAPAQPGAPPCGTCEAGYIHLQLTGLASYGSAKQDEFSAPLVIGTDSNGNALERDHGTKHPVLLTADWWTKGGTLRLAASAGTPAMAWSPFGEKKRDAPPAAGVKIPAGWYFTEIWCTSKQCENVTLTVDGKPVVPYAIPWRQP